MNPSEDEAQKLADKPARVVLDPQFERGQVVGGRYEIISCLGTGGMGVVYRVKQIFLNTEFALKTLDKRSLTEKAIKRFQHEARTTFSLDHPSIIAVKDYGVLDDETPFLVMEFLNGQTLGERLKRSGSVPLAEAIPIFVQVCFGLAFAHDRGIVHRDIKPSNIMLLKGYPSGAEGSVKIVDFGIAKFTGEGDEIQSLTRTGEIFGSPLYMSPEQCGGQRVDHRADVYSLGCVIFETLTGTPPFIGDSALSTMMKHQQERAPTLREATLGGDFPESIEEIVATMLAKSPADRYNNLGIVAHNLGALSRGVPPSKGDRSARGEPPRQKAKSERQDTISMKRSSLYALLLCVAIFSAALAGGAVYVMERRNNGEKSPLAKVVEPPVSLEKLRADSRAREAALEKATDGVIPVDVLEKQLALADHTHIFMVRHRTLSDESIRLIAKHPAITKFDVIDTDVPNECLYRLAELPLRRISLGQSNLNDVGAEALSHCLTLENFEANGTNLTDDGVCKLAALNDLKQLDIGGTKISDKSLLALAASPKLTDLGLRAVMGISREAWAALAKSHVQDLDLESARLDDSCFTELSKLATLRKIDLSYTDVTIHGLKELCKNKRLRIVNIRRCPHLGSAAVQILETLFPNIKFLNPKESPKEDDV